MPAGRRNRRKADGEHVEGSATVRQNRGEGGRQALGSAGQTQGRG